MEKRKTAMTDEEISQLLKQVENLEKENNELKKRKRYGLVWEEQEENSELQLHNEYPILESVKSRDIINDLQDPINLLIEGDNLHALNTFMYTNRNSFKLIYIDPPYSLGNNDFMYNDRFVNKDDTWRHSKWLSFMAKRLKLAKEMMTDDGVLFISIDDNEFSQLKLLCDEIIGENHFLGNITWIKKTKPINSGKARINIQQSVEYILCYSKQTKNDFKGFKLKGSGERNYSKTWTLGPCRMVDLEDSDYGRKKRDTMKFPILGVAPGSGKRWKIGLDEAKKLEDTDRIAIVGGKPKKVIYPFDEKPEIMKPFWSHFEKEVGTAETGKAELTRLIGDGHGFDTVKPVNLIKEILYHFDDNIKVLDFFAGSGTTGQAVLEMNTEDGGNRQFVLCTNNENGICEKITYKRLSNLINGFISTEGEEVGGIGGNLKYYRTDFINKNQNYHDLKNELFEKSTDLLAIKENTFELFGESEEFKILTGINKVVGIYFDYDVEYEILDEIKKSLHKFEDKEKILYLPDGFDVERDTKLIELCESGIELKKIPKKIMEILEGAL